ncbi:CDP-glycerol glycerophosphotransferase family protein [Hansschlegelia sp.]|uniref:CDP-glycerol glycerophosphotransferase family protein n=1 Tax=Hansschlegelia sp. TaxID=2041892 RepID=UPI002B90CA13|nr:CDP-glycerol glycerophosphotransferase family protein [Hansschlegelia sp.]HVI27304.1 CDP-glycerol glycerophosphotransferase family protein [Hansschlegelia sp.]
MAEISTFEVVREVMSLWEREADRVQKLDRDMHYLVRMSEGAAGLRLFLVARAATGCPDAVYLRPRGQPRSTLKPELVYQDDTIVLYTLTLKPRHIVEQARFFLRQDDAWHRVIRPFHTGIDLPPGWGFSAHHLYLEYGMPKSDAPMQRAFIQYVETADDAVVLKGVLIANRKIGAATLGIRKFRDEGKCWTEPVKLKRAGWVFRQPGSAYQVYRGEQAYRFEVKLSLDWSLLPASIYSVTLHVDDRATGLHAFNAHFSGRQKPLAVGGVVVHPFIDRASATLRFERLAITSAQWDELARYAASAPARDVCLFGEYTNAARDNATHLFRYALDRGHVRSYYVIEEEFRSEVGGEHVLSFGSYEHLRRCVECGVIAFTHHPSYVYPYFAETLLPRYPRTIFLQHGVTALKKSMDAYASSRRAFDVFAVCSTQEAGFVMKACKYEPSRIRAAGFPRFDNLVRLAQARVGESRDIIVFPTWRPGLERMTLDEFAASNFCGQWAAAIDRLREAADELGANLRLVGHPIIARHVEQFGARAHDIADVSDIQEILAGAACVITDYSSIAFDALYIGRPTVFFTFDAEEYRFAENAFIDVERDLPGPRAATPDEVEREVRQIWSRRGAADSALERARRQYFRHVDDRNCERLMQAVSDCLEIDRNGGSTDEGPLARETAE